MFSNLMWIKHFFQTLLLSFEFSKISLYLHKSYLHVRFVTEPMYTSDTCAVFCWLFVYETQANNTQSAVRTVVTGNSLWALWNKYIAYFWSSFIELHLSTASTRSSFSSCLAHRRYYCPLTCGCRFFIYCCQCKIVTYIYNDD